MAKIKLVNFTEECNRIATDKRSVSALQKIAAGIFGGLAALFLWNAGRNDGAAEIAEAFGEDPLFYAKTNETDSEE